MIHASVLHYVAQAKAYTVNNANLDRGKFDIFYKIDCCAAIRGHKWMNNLSNERRITMLSPTEISVVTSFINFEIF